MTQKRAATRLAQKLDLENLAELNGTHLINLLAETGNIISHDISENPKQGYVRGIFIEDFDPQRLALPPAKNGIDKNKHGDWINYLDAELRVEITSNFEANFSNPIITVVETKKPSQTTLLLPKRQLPADAQTDEQ